MIYGIRLALAWWRRSEQHPSSELSDGISHSNSHDDTVSPGPRSHSSVSAMDEAYIDDDTDDDTNDDNDDDTDDDNNDEAI